MNNCQHEKGKNVNEVSDLMERERWRNINDTRISRRERKIEKAKAIIRPIKLLK